MSIVPLRFSRAAAAVAAALCVAFPTSALAHDPGLSSLDVSVGQERVVVVLSLAASDGRLASAGETIDAFTLRSIALSVDGVPLSGSVSGRVADDAGACVTLAFERIAGSQLTVSSAVPARLSRGHRQIVRIRTGGRMISQRMLDSRANSVEAALTAGTPDVGVVREFVALGTRHILGGYDHLLFLAALLLGVRRLSSVVKTVTAFTAAHSLTLSLAVVGIVQAPAEVVEPLIAASIVFVGVENLVSGQMESRWKLTFAFGLVHGFGFAGALQDLGVGAGGAGIAAPLASFNAGVELGQIGVAILLWPVIRRMNATPDLRLRLAPVCSLLVVAAGVYWILQRTM